MRTFRIDFDFGSGVRSRGPASESLSASGSLMVKVVPCPGVDSISNLPRCRSTIPWTMESPRPVPSSPLVEKNGSRQRWRTLSLIPVPVSRTRTMALFTSIEVSRRTRPPFGIASTALKIRFVRISRRADSSPATNGAALISVVTSTWIPFAWLCDRHLGSVSDTAWRTIFAMSTIGKCLVRAGRAIKLTQTAHDTGRVFGGGAHHLEASARLRLLSSNLSFCQE